jgi:hypothetical protein
LLLLLLVGEASLVLLAGVFALWTEALDLGMVLLL